MKLFAVTLAVLAFPATITAAGVRQLATVDAQTTASLTGYFSTCPGENELIPCASGQLALNAKLTVAVDSQAYTDAVVKFTAAAIDFGVSTADYAVEYVFFRKTAYVINVLASAKVAADLSVEAKGNLVLGTSWLTFLTAAELAAINGYLEDTVDPWSKEERVPATDSPTKAPVEGVTSAPVKSPTKAPVQATEINWAAKGVVGPVFNQGSCGSCWAFAAVSASQGLSAIETGYLNLLSPQQLVDCAPEDNVCYGCNGGNYVTLWRNGKGYATKNYISTSASYAYTAKTETCSSDGKTAVFKADGVIQLSRNSAATDAEMKALVRKQPVSVSISAGCSAFSSYKSGILTASACVSGCDEPKIDHAVLLVGFGVDASTNQEFWIVQNSWGTRWGEDGFVRLAMSGEIYNSDLRAYGTCGINANPAAPESTETKEGCEEDACGGVKVGDSGAASTAIGGAVSLGALLLAMQNI